MVCYGRINHRLLPARNRRHHDLNQELPDNFARLARRGGIVKP
jgi:hypothetical protein